MGEWSLGGAGLHAEQCLQVQPTKRPPGARFLRAAKRGGGSPNDDGPTLGAALRDANLAQLQQLQTARRPAHYVHAAMPTVQSTDERPPGVPLVIPLSHARPHGIAHLLHIRTSEPQTTDQHKEAETGAAAPVLVAVRLKETLQVRKLGPPRATRVVDHHTLRILVTPEVIILEGLEDTRATPSTGIEEHLAATGAIGIEIQQGRVATLLSVPSQIDKAASLRAPINGGLDCGTTQGEPVLHRVRGEVKFQGRNAHALGESPEDAVQLHGIGSVCVAPFVLGTQPVQ